MHVQSKSEKKLTLDLLCLLWINKLRYSPNWESWSRCSTANPNQWHTIDYPQLVNIAALILSGLTKEKADTQETKKMLQQIERWMTQSNGELMIVTEANQKKRCYPTCLMAGDQCA